MADFNINQATLTHQEDSALDLHLKAIERIFEAKLKYLSELEIKGAPKMGDRIGPLSTEVIGFMKTKPDFMPRYQNPEVLTRLLAEIKKYDDLKTYFQKMATTVEKSNVFVKSLASREGQMYIKGVEAGVSAKIAGATEVQTSLAKYFGKKSPAKSGDKSSSPVRR